MLVDYCATLLAFQKYNFHVGSAEPPKPQSSTRRESPARIRRSGSLNLDPDIFKTTNFTDSDNSKELSSQNDLLIFQKYFRNVFWTLLHVCENEIFSLICEHLVSQWPLRGVCFQGTPVLSARFLSPLTQPHLAPSYCPPTHWLHSREACLLQHCPAIMLTLPSLCPTPGPTRKTTPLTSETPAPGETQQAQQRVSQYVVVCCMWKCCCFMSLVHFISSFFPALPPPGDFSSRCSPRPLRASLVSSPSTSSFRRALSSTRATLSISPVVPQAEQAYSHNGQRSNAPGSPQNQQLEKDLHLDPVSINTAQDPQEEDPLDMQEVSKLPVHFFYYQ